MECPIAGCGYTTNMREYDEARRQPLCLKSTRSKANGDAHRDMDGFDRNEELARLRRAIKEAYDADAEDELIADEGQEQGLSG